MAEALYRKYRPQVFEDVVGQEPIERTLKNAISQDKVSHAYLFTGPRGTGKTTTARLLAKALLCEHGPTPDPDGTCQDCLLIAEGTHPDVYELDAASRTGVENVREEIISRVHFAPTRGRYKVYIIDEVHMLSTAAFNALLKTLEEPPSHVVFILCTTDPQKVPETIHSRCQRFDFHRISPESMVARLGAICIAEEVEFEGEALDLIAQRAEGGLRNALTSLEQIIAFENGKVTLAGAERLLGSIDSSDLVEIMAYIGKRDIANCFRWTARYVETGADLAQFVRDMAEHVRDLYIMALIGDDAEIEVSETARRQLASEQAWFGPDRAARLLGVLGDLMAGLKTTSNPRLAFEVALTRMVRPDSDLTLEALAERVEALESGYSSVAHVLPGEPFVQDAHDGNETADARADDDQPRVSAPEPADASRAPGQPGAFHDAAPSGGAGEPDASTASGTSAHPASAPASEGAMHPENAVPPATAMQPAEGARPGANRAAPETARPASEAPLEREPHQPQERAGRNGNPRTPALSNPATLQRMWQAVLADVKKQKQSHGVLFMNTKVDYDAAASTLVVRFPAESTFVFNAAQKPDAQDALASALAKTVGEPVAFRYERGNGGNAVETAAFNPQPDMVANTMPEPTDASGGAIASGNDGAGVSAKQTPAPQPAASAVTATPPAAEGRTATAMPADSPFAAAPADEGPAATMDDAPPYEDAAFYESVPYEDMPYYETPYDEVPYAEFDAGTNATPSEPRLDRNGAIEEDTAALQAMLQASFGESVVLSETDE